MALLLTAPSEAKEQTMLIEMISIKYPNLIFRVGMEAGKRNPRFAKEQGVSSGWPDLYFPYESRGYKALWIELKKRDAKLFKKDKVTPKDQRIANQIRIMNFLENRGHVAKFCFGAKEALNTIDWYLNEEEKQFAGEIK